MRVWVLTVIPLCIAGWSWLSMRFGKKHKKQGGGEAEEGPMSKEAALGSGNGSHGLPAEDHDKPAFGALHPSDTMAREAGTNGPGKV
jgi:hypothetical protein